MSNTLPILWEDKINNPELLAFFYQFGSKTYLSAEEINQLRNAVNYLNSVLETLEQTQSADANFIHTQTIPSDTWSINHQLKKYPAVTIIDTNGNEIEAEVFHIDQNNLTITFSVVFIGTAVLN